MLTVASAVADTLFSSEAALSALSEGWLNLSAYAKKIRPEIEAKTKKTVTVGSIVAALSRLSRQTGGKHPIEVPVRIENLTVKSPLIEVVFDKSSETLSMLQTFLHRIPPESSEFVTVTQGTNEITLICSPHIYENAKNIFTTAPKMVLDQLVSLSVRFGEGYQDQPNILYSLIRRLALKKIVIAEVVSTFTELTFILNSRDLEAAVSVFSNS